MFARSRFIGFVATGLMLVFTIYGNVLSQSPQPNSTRTDQDQDDVLRINTDLVVLNVTVLDTNGKFGSGLGRNDFKVLEDRTEQTISSFSAEETPFAAAILLDTSGSMESRMTMAR